MASHASAMPERGNLSFVAQRILDIGNSRLVLAALVCLYQFVTYYIFVDVIGSNTGFVLAGFEYYPAADGTIALALGAALLPLIWLRIRCDQLSDVLVLQIYFFVFLPSTIYMTVAVPASFERQLQTNAMLLAALLLLEARRFIPPAAFLRASLPEITFMRIIFGLCAAVAIYLAVFGELSLDRLDLSNVYERRAESIQVRGGTLPTYVANWSSFALAPLALYLGISRRRWILALLGLIIAVESFAATSFRSHLFLPIFAAAVGFLAAFLSLRRIGLLFATLVLAMSILPLALDLVMSSGGLYSWLTHFRFIGNNGFLTAQYFDFFEFAQKGMYQDTFGRFLFDPVYHRPISELVGSDFSIEGNHANGNFWADGYGNLGFGGVMFASISLLFICWVLDSINNLAFPMAAVVLIVAFGFGVGNTSVHSVLTSNGGALLLALLLLFPRQNLAAPAHSGAEPLSTVAS